MLLTFFANRGWRRLAIRGFAGLVALVATSNGQAAETGVRNFRCVNTVGGATWSMAVDFDHKTVDSVPATINDKWISWHDPKGGYLDLERATGKLSMRAASTTGGYFLHYNCQAE